MSDRQQVEGLCRAALERPAHERAAFLLEATGGDDVLRREVEISLARKTGSDTVQIPKSTDFASGNTISHYLLAAKLGAGGMGMVYLAHDSRLDRDVALKLLPAGRLASEFARNLFRKEALALGKLNHPNIGAVYDFDSQEGVDFLVMEYVPGQTLAQQISSGPMLEGAVLKTGIQIVDALQEAHEQGIVHRDLKPGNVVVTPKGQAKVLDFGLAKLLEPAGEAQTADELSSSFGAGVGTLPYMAPEQLRGQPADPRSDIYAAGTVLYEMSTGRRPFLAKVPTALAADIQVKKPIEPRRLNSGISVALEQIILKCLEKDPGDRYQSAKELLVDLRRMTRDSNRGENAERKNKRQWWVGLGVTGLAAALVASVYVAQQRSWLWFKPVQGKMTLAVLPFENLNHDPKEEYFCDGLTDEMINQLGRLMPQRLGVIARTSAMRYKGTQKRADEIGRELGATYLLETSVRREKGRVRIAAQLIQAREQTALWTETYEYDEAGVFALETDVARRVAGSLALQLLPASRSYRTNPQAYEAYLQGRYHWHKGSAEEKRKAREYYEQAIKMDPRFAPAYADLAGYYWATGDFPPATAMPKARENANKALELDNTLTQAHIAEAGIQFYGDWNWVAAESEFQRALALNPNDAEAHRTYSVYLLTQARFEEALREVKRAQELDPLSLFTSVNAGWTLYFARQYDGAIEQCHKALELEASSDGAHACLGWSKRAKGLRDEAIRESELAVALSNREASRLAGLARVYAVFGRKDEARKCLAELEKQQKEKYVSPYYIAMIHAALEEAVAALAALEQAYAERDRNLTWLKVEDAFDAIRGEARFQDLVRRIGLPP
jgi:eukaryotic-like serine/threonine-protein kinase